MTRGKNMKALEARLDLVRREIDKLKAQESLLLELIRADRGDKAVVRPGTPRPNIKHTVLELLERAGDAGINAASAVEAAAQEGVTMERGSVSSVLSRLKNEGTVEYDGTMYRLAQRKGDGGTIHLLRTSGALQ